MSKTLKLSVAQTGQRLDLALSQVSGLSRSYWHGRIKARAVRVAGQEVKASYIVTGNEKVTVEAEAEVQSGPIAMPKLTELYRDDDVIVIEKPAGLLSHTTKPGEASVAASLASEVRDDDAERPGIVHRLDRDTSGVMVVARNPKAKAFLQAQFTGRKVKKTYLMLVRGTPKDLEAVIKLPIGRSKARPTSRTVRASGKEAVTRYKVLERLSGYALIEAQPETGRTHQIRVHFAHLGHPVVGDITYGDKQRPRGLSRQFLHAASLTLTLPSGTVKTFHSTLPNDLEEFLLQLKKQL